MEPVPVIPSSGRFVLMAGGKQGVLDLDRCSCRRYLLGGNLGLGKVGE